MRDFKFRVYSKEHGMSEPCNIFDIQIMDMEGLTDMNEVEIMQYTGLKDKNGKEIYENDIVKFGDMDRIVLFEKGSFVLRIIKILFAESLPLQYCNLEKIEVIGNIQENPEFKVVI